MIASAGYFEAIGARLLEGRMFNAADTGGTNALLVSESFAKRYSADRPVVGRRVFEGGCTATTCAPTYIVGVVSDVKYDGLSGTGEAAYVPATEGMGRGGYLMIRTRGDPRAVVPAVRSAVRSLDPAVPLDAIGPMTDRVYESTAQPRHWALLLTAFAIAAVTLAAIGVFGLLSYLVTTMRREIGVRVALGAQRGEIARMIVQRGMTNCLAGAVVGVGLALAGRRMIEASLYQVSPGDPATLIAVTTGLLGVALMASFIPARRAARIDPMTAIRAD
jgi:putative ABC transport system permease protein